MHVQLSPREWTDTKLTIVRRVNELIKSYLGIIIRESSVRSVCDYDFVRLRIGPLLAEQDDLNDTLEEYKSNSKDIRVDSSHRLFY